MFVAYKTGARLSL